MRLLAFIFYLLASLGSPVAAQKSTAPLWPFHRTYSWPPGQGVVVVFHQSKVFGLTTRAAKDHESRPIRTRRFPYKPKKFLGWRSRQTFKVYNRQGQRLTSTHYDYVGMEADRRILLGRQVGLKKVVHVYIDSLGRTTPYNYARRR